MKPTQTGPLLVTAKSCSVLALAAISSALLVQLSCAAAQPDDPLAQTRQVDEELQKLDETPL